MRRWLPFVTFLACAAVQAGERPNVVLFFIDTLRADHVGAYGYKRPTTPNLDAVAGRGALFEQAIAQSSWSLPSYSSIFTGLYPQAHGANDTNQLLDPALARLAAIYAAFGYDTAAFVGGGHLSRIFGMADGFATYADKPHYGSLFHTVPPALEWLSARREKPAERAAGPSSKTGRAPGESGAGGPAARAAGDKPFFLVVHGYDPHLPYQVPLGFSEMYDPGYRGVVHDLGILRFENAKRISGNVYHHGEGIPQGKDEQNDDDLVPLHGLPKHTPLGEADRAHIVAHYDGAITYADTWLGLFLAGLEERGLLDGTLLVVAGDHGEALGEKGYFQHRWDLYDSQIHVPLVLSGPGVAKGRRLRRIVELVDLAPTLLELCRIPPRQEHQGVSLAPLLGEQEPPAPATDRIAFSWLSTSVSARTTQWHLIRFATGRTELYDIAADPAEQRDLAAANPKICERLESRLADWHERYRRTPTAREAALTEAERTMFRRSGYW